MRISKWVSSLAARLPRRIVEVLDLKEGDDIESEVVDRRRLAVRRSAGIDDVLERLRAYRGRMPEGFTFDRLEANRRD